MGTVHSNRFPGKKKMVPVLYVKKNRGEQGGFATEMHVKYHLLVIISTVKIAKVFKNSPPEKKKEDYKESQRLK